MRVAMSSLLIAVVFTSVATAQTDWTAVQGLRSGTYVRVQADRNMPSPTGTLESADDRQITVLDSGERVIVPRFAVRLIEWTAEQPHAVARRTFIGFLWGALAGVVPGIGAGMQEGTKALPRAMLV